MHNSVMNDYVACSSGFNFQIMNTEGRHNSEPVKLIVA